MNGILCIKHTGNNHIRTRPTTRAGVSPICQEVVQYFRVQIGLLVLTIRLRRHCQRNHPLRQPRYNAQFVFQQPQWCALSGKCEMLEEFDFYGRVKNRILHAKTNICVNVAYPSCKSRPSTIRCFSYHLRTQSVIFVCRFILTGRHVSTPWKLVSIQFLFNYPIKFITDKNGDNNEPD